MYSWNRAEWADVFFGAFKARVVPINVNYRYVAHELEYILENSDSEVLIFERSFAPVVAEILPKLPKVRATIVIEDGSDEDAGAALDYHELVDAQDDRGRSGTSAPTDDLYFLYTGGTTGMPKGVMWRHEDIFSAALSSACGRPHLARRRSRRRASPRTSPGPSMIVAPLMHGAAQWGMCNMLFAGAGVALYTQRGLDPDEIWDIVEREKCMGLTIVGDAMGRPLADALAHANRERDFSGFYRVGSGGGVFSPAVQEAIKAQIPHIQVMDSYGASEMGAGGMSAEGGARRFTVSPELNVLDDDLRPVAAGRDRPPRPHRPHPARLLQGRGQDRGHLPDRPRRRTGGRCPATSPPSTTTAWSPCSAAARSASTPAARRSTRRRSRRRSRATPTSTTPSSSACPTSGGVSGSWRSCRPVGDARPTVEEIAHHCRQTIAGYKVPRALTFVDGIQRSPAGKADYRWAKEQASAS